jgi:hypothetical protein
MAVLRLLFLACVTLGTVWSSACIRHVATPEGQAITQAARQAADRFVRENQAGGIFVGPFLRTEYHDDEVWVIYERLVPPDVIQSHDTVRVAYNRKTGATRWVIW